MTTAQAPRATAEQIQTAYDAADDAIRAARRDEAAARRRVREAARTRDRLQAEADRLGLVLVITRRPHP